MTTRCEGSLFGVAAGGVPFAYHSLIRCLHFAYTLLVVLTALYHNMGMTARAQVKSMFFGFDVVTKSPF